MKENTKVCRIKNFTKRFQIQIRKSTLRNLILKYEVFEEIYDKNLKRPRNVGDIGSFGDMVAGKSFAIERKLSRFISAILGRQ